MNSLYITGLRPRKLQKIFATSIYIRAISVLVVAFIALVACRQQPEVITATSTLLLTKTPALSTPRPSSLSATQGVNTIPQPTATPTRTPQPTATTALTPSITPTPTPLVPTPQPNMEYRLVEWTPERAEQLITMLQAYPETFDFYQRGYHDDGYYFSFRYAALAQAEATYRFPTSPMATQWKWQYAYNLAQMGRNQVGKVYATLLANGLNNGETNLANLLSWFSTYEPQLKLTLIPLEPLPGYISGSLLEISDYLFTGVYLWLVESSTGFQIYPLESDWDFGFAHSAGLIYTLADITGDGVQEAITIHEHQPGGPGMLTATFDVYDLSQTPPRRLLFEPPYRFSPYGNWDIRFDQSGQSLLHFEKFLDPLICEGTTNSDFQWNGVAFALVQSEYPDIRSLISSATEDIQKLCPVWAYNDLHYDAIALNENALTVLENLLAEWPQFPTMSSADEPFSPDVQDELHFELGLLRALKKDFEAARQHMTTIITNPVIPESKWILPAKQFLATYQSVNALPDACITTKSCYPVLNNATLIELALSQSPENVSSLLSQFGVPVYASGTYDFDNDGFVEHWLLLAPREGSWVELWIVAQTGELKTAAVSSVETYAEPVVLKPLLNIAGKRVFLLQIGNGEIGFTVETEPITHSLTIQPFYRTYAYGGSFRELLSILTNDLFTGHDPAEVIESIQSLQQLMPHTCPDYPHVTFWCHDLYYSYYLLGLSYELMGDETNAMATYLYLWRNYPNSPYAIMAQAKLETVQ